MSDYLKVENKGHVYILTMNRPDKLNAMNSENIEEIARTVSELSENKDCKVIIITGSGKAFCSGADINNQIGNLSPMERTVKFSRQFKDMFRIVENARPFTIAAVNGYALGGGIELSLACDIRIAADTAKMGLVEPHIGSFPGGAGIIRLPRLIGLGKAKEVLALAEKFTAHQCYEYGFVEHVVPAEQLLDYSIDLANKIAKNSITAIAAGKRIMTASMSMDFEKACELETAWLGYYAESHDRLEGRKAFKEKRDPDFE